MSSSSSSSSPSLDEQIHQAVSLAFNPGSLQPQALHFLQQLRENPLESWHPGLVSFLAGNPSPDTNSWIYKYPPQTRLFGLQLVDTMLQLSTSSDQEAALVNSCYQTTRQQLWDYIHREFVQGPGEQGLPYLRNKLVQTLFLLFFQSYPNDWPDFFSSFINLLRQHPISQSDPSPPLNPRTTDLYLRLLHQISSELSDALLRINKSPLRLTQDAKLRDAIRERDAAIIIKDTFGIVAESLLALESGPNQSNQIGLHGKSALDALEMGIRVVEHYASWIDLSLIITPTWIPFLYQSLRLAFINVRLAAADAFICIVTKGMPASNRIELYNLLGIIDVLKTIKTENHHRRQSGEWNDDEEDQLNERLAKILNGMGVELCKVFDDPSPEVQSSSMELVRQLLPLLLSFVEQDQFGVCVAVIPFLSAILSRYKKEAKISPNSHLTDERKSFLFQLLKLIVLKVRYPPDDVLEWEPPTLPGETEDEDTSVFLERRRQLKTLIESIASIDQSIFQETIDPLISNVLDHLGSQPTNPIDSPWQEVELAMVMLYNYGEAVRGCGLVGPRSYVLVPPEEIKKQNKNKDQYKINYIQYPLSSLGNHLLKASKALGGFKKFNHPSVYLQWFESVVRYHEFFDIFSSVIQDVLPTFLDDRGLHHPDAKIRYRSSYLFYRFVLQGKPAIQLHYNLHGWQAIIDQLRDLLVIQAEIPSHLVPNATAVDHDILVKVVQASTIFDSQLYLFESIGILLSFYSIESDHQIQSLKSILDPLINLMRIELNDKSRPSLHDLTNALKIHHSILAIGSIAKGFPNLSCTSPFPPWLLVFKSATDDIMSVTERLNDIRVIRDATRSSFHKIVATIGMEALPHLPILINCLLDKLTKPELVEFLSFVGQLVHKYKDNFGRILDSLLLPLLSKIMVYLDQPITGTDDVLIQSELRRGYFNLFNSIIGASLQEIFVSPKNQMHLETILKTIITQLLAEEVLTNDLKLGFGVMKNFTSIWVKPCSNVEVTEKQNVASEAVPGFHIFLYQNLVPLCFSIPKRSNFDWSDAESYLVLNEITGILKMLLTTRGSEFVEFLMMNLFPTIDCSNERGQKLIQGIQETTHSKPSKKPLLEFFGGNPK